MYQLKQVILWPLYSKRYSTYVSKDRERNQFRIFGGHGQLPKDHHQEQSISLCKSLGHMIEFEAYLDQDVVFFNESIIFIETFLS